MKNLVLIFISVGSLLFYFSLSVFLLPDYYLSKEQLTPIPYFESELSDSEIFLGESFRLNILSENRGDHGDIHIVSIGFPTLSNTQNIVKIVGYDFTHSPKFVIPGDEIGFRYSGGVETVKSDYPLIEAMSRPIPPGAKHHVDLLITPEESGPFFVYVKSVDIPHTSNLSHYPDSGKLDPQDEYVLVYTVNVNP